MDLEVCLSRSSRDDLAHALRGFGGSGEDKKCNGKRRQDDLVISSQWRFLIQQAICNRCVAVDPTVAKEGPVAADLFERFQIDITHEYLFTIMRPFRQHAAEGIAEEGSAPELESLTGSRLAAHIACFETDPIYDCYVDSVCDGMSSLDRAPRVVLRDTEFRLLGGMPADRGWINRMCAPCRAVRRAPSGYH